MSHIPVLFDECMRLLEPERGGIYADGTLGGAGHSLGILERGADRLIGVDKDDAAIERAKQRLEYYKDKLTLVKSDFKALPEIARELDIKLDGAILDLGVSSFQLDEAERGFSYAKEAPLDMRMDENAPLSARQVVNEYAEAELKSIIYKYGEEKFAPRIAAAIAAARPIETTTQLADIIKKAIPAAARRTGGHPAKRTFQAIRIEVNQELTGLGEAVSALIEQLNTNGRLLVITFHSLEDRIVKQAMRTAESPCTCPPELPVCICGKQSLGRCIPKKPIIPQESELAENPRSRSAKLRVFVRS